MVDIGWPLGVEKGVTLDSLLARQQAEIRRTRTPFEPPEGTGVIPDLVTKSFYTSAQKADLITRGSAIAVRQDAKDLSFNFGVQAAAEVVSGVDHRRVVTRADLGIPTMADIVRVRERDAIAQTRRLQLSAQTFPSPSVWNPTVLTENVPPVQWSGPGVRPPLAPPEVEAAQQKGVLDRLSGITAGVQRTWNSARNLLTGDQSLQSAGMDMESGVSQIGAGTVDLSLQVASFAVEATLGAPERIVQAVEQRDPKELLNIEQGQSAAGLQRAASMLGKTFDGEAFWRGVWINGGAAVANALTPFGETSFAEYQAQAEANWERYYADIPRPAQVFVEEANVGNIAIALAGGPLSRVLLSSGTRGAAALGRLVAPMASNPLIAVPAEVGVNAGLRIGYEESEGAPAPLRITAAVAVGAAMGLAPAAVARVVRGLGDEAAGGVARAAVTSLDDLTKITDPDDLAAALRSASPDDLRRMADEAIELIDPPGMVGLARSSDPSMAVKAALGDGGLVKMGDPDEMLSPIGRAVRESWRNVDQPEGDYIGARFIPFTGSPRTRRLPGNKLTAIPDVITVQRDPSLFGVVDQTTLTSGRSRAQQVQTSVERAGDWAAQQQTTVPPGTMQAIRNAQADFQIRQGRLTPAIDFFNHASDLPTVRTAVSAKSQAESEFIARTFPSRKQFLGRVREMFGSTDRLPDKIQYVGPPTRPWGQRRAVPAAEHPLTGTIIDFLENPGFYDADPLPFIPEFLRYTNRGSAVNNAMKSDFGVSVGTFDSGIFGSPTQTGVFFPTRDAGLGRIARGGGAFPLGSAPGSTFNPKKFGTVTARMADPLDGEGFEPITDLYQLFTRLDMEKAREVGREAVRYAMGGSRERVPGWQRVAALGDDQWLPVAEAQDIARYLDSEQIAFFEALSNLKNLTLGADASPFAIQGGVGWMIAPYQVSRDIINGLATGLRQGDPLRPLRTDAMYQDMAAAPQRWMRFFTAMGRVPDTGTPKEWRAQYVEKMPVIGGKIAGLNDSITNALVRGQESTFDGAVTTLMTRGFSEADALAAGADITRMAWLQSGAEVLGESARRQSLERGTFISSTFIRQPVNFMAHAARGYEQIIVNSLLHPNEIGTVALWQRVGPREQLAAQMFTRLAGTLTGASAISAVLTADERGYSPAEAAQNALNPTHPDFLTLWVTKDIKLPLGGPYRALMRAAAPQPLVVGGVTVVDGPVPFGGVPQFIKNRITTTAQTAEDLITNEDFFGNPIYATDSIIGLAQALAYAAQSTMPVSTSAPLEAYQRGESTSQGIGRTVFEFFGQQPQAATEYAVLERERRLSARAIYNMPVDQKAALGMTADQVAASRDARTLTQLREAVGTRAANYLTQQQSEGVAVAREAYVADLRKRSADGDVDAEAILVSIKLQDELAALAVDVTDENGVVDRIAYRTARSSLVDRNIGQNEAFAEVFESFKQSDNQIDRLTGEKYALRDQAQRKRLAPNGEEVSLGLDFEVLEQLEREFDARIGPDLASLVDANMAFASLEANALEVERRAVVGDLTLSGLWDIEDKVFSAGRAQALAAFTAAAATGAVPNVDEARLKSAFQNSRTVTEFRQSLAPYVVQQILIEQPSLTTGEAQRLSETVLDNATSAIYDASGVGKRLWVSEHLEDGLAQRAYEWGYVTTAQYRDGGGFARLAEQEAAATTGDAPETAAELTVNQQIVKAINEEGLSYGQAATRFGLTRDAVIGRYKRATAKP